MAKRQMDTRSPRGLLLGLLGLAGAGALMILLLFLKPGLPSSPTSTAEATLPPPPENPYTEADFYTEDGFVHCSAAPAKTGIDVSSHQEEIDWAAVAASGVDYAMIRVGYRGYDQGGLHIDTYAEANLQVALDAGLPVGGLLLFPGHFRGRGPGGGEHAPGIHPRLGYHISRGV